MFFDTSVIELIRHRYSCRTYLDQPLDSGIVQQLVDYATSNQVGPFKNPIRFRLVAASDGDSKALKGLGTYGFIKDAAGFIIGAVREGHKNLEDFGYLMEKIILYATYLGLGTCWLGGTFTKSSFAQRLSLAHHEIIPAVTALGYIASNTRYLDAKVRQLARSDQRRPWERLFHKSNFDTPLTQAEAGEYATPLEMVRLGPSASNKQPWQVIMGQNDFHFYLRRTPNYRNNTYARLLGFADLQRIDMGIAICHFELTALELGLEGRWEVDEPVIEKNSELIEYTASWVR